MIGVTGGTGFIGQRLVALLAQDSAVRVLCRRIASFSCPNTEYVIGDLTSPQATDGFVRGCTAVIHMAGIAHTGLRTEAERRRSYEVNVEGTRTVLGAALRHGVQRFVFVSTAHVYAVHAGRDLEEASLIAPSSFYSQTKIEAEQLVRDAGKEGMQIVIARPCLIYGPGARFNLNRMMRAIDAGYYFHLSGVNPVRSFLSLENAARALLHLVNSRSAEGAYNLADRNPFSLVDFTNELSDRMKRRRPRTVSSAVLRAMGTIGSTVQTVGIHLPISREVVSKLTSDFTLSTCRLAQTGFEWGTDGGALRQQMVDDYLRAKC